MGATILVVDATQLIRWSLREEFESSGHRVVEASTGLSLREAEAGGGSEDYTYMMRRVQDLGGFATNIGFGADIGGWGHHTAAFDLDESALPLAVELLVRATLDLQANPIQPER